MANPYYIGWGLTSAFAAVALSSSWRNIITHAPSAGKKDYGLAYLSAAFGVWVLISLWGLADVKPLHIDAYGEVFSFRSDESTDVLYFCSR